MPEQTVMVLRWPEKLTDDYEAASRAVKQAAEGSTNYDVELKRYPAGFNGGALDTDDLVLMLALLDSLLELQRALQYAGMPAQPYDEARAGIMRLRTKIRGAL